jgi:hypothetical protein
MGNLLSLRQKKSNQQQPTIKTPSHVRQLKAKINSANSAGVAYLYHLREILNRENFGVGNFTE